MNSVTKLEKEKGAEYIQQKTLSFIINESNYKIRTNTKEIFENQQTILIREYFIPILFSEKFISEIIFDYVKLINEIITFQKSSAYLKNPISKQFMKYYLFKEKIFELYSESQQQINSYSNQNGNHQFGCQDKRLSQTSDLQYFQNLSEFILLFERAKAQDFQK
jgi:hypothetical protein